MRQKRETKLIALLLVLSMIALSACGNGSSQQPADETQESAAAEADEGGEAEVVGDNDANTVHILADFNIMDGIDSLTDNKYVDFIQEKTGVKVVMDSPGGGAYQDKLNVVLASGADIDSFMTYDRDLVMKLANDDMLVDFGPYINDAENYPNIASQMKPEAWLPVTQDGKVYGFPYSRFDAFHQVVYIRKQWLENLGLEVPKTIDDYYNVLRAFTFDDPDQDGKDNTFGLLCGQDITGGVAEGSHIFRAAFDADSYKIIDGVITPPEITDNYKEYLKFMNKLVEEGLMDPEFPNNMVSVYMDKLKTYQYGMTNYFWHANQLPEYDEGKVHENWLSVDLPLGQDGNPSKFYYGSINRSYNCTPTTSSKVEPLMKLYDWVCSPDEGERWLYLGIEGDEYQINDAGDVEVLKQRNSLHWMFTMISPGILNENVKKYNELNYPKETVERLDLAAANGELDELKASLPYYPDLANFNLNKVVEEYAVSAVLGNVNIDETWDDYVKKYKAAGGEAAMEFWTEWYNANN